MPRLRFLPQWWVRQYSHACVIPPTASERLRNARQCVFEPALNREDWDLLSLLMAYLQREILKRPRRQEQWVPISDSAFLHSCTEQAIPADDVVRFWGLLSVLRAKSGEVVLPFSQCEQTSDGLRFCVERTNFRALFGFDVLPCVDTTNVEGADGAVLIREDLWMALPSELRLSYLIMEQHVQSRGLARQRTFSLSVADLFPAREASKDSLLHPSSGESIVEPLRRLLQIGRILAEHKWLVDLEGERLGPMPDDPDDIVLVWEVRDFARQAYADAYRRTLECMIASLEENQIEALVDGWVSREQVKVRQQSASEWWQILAAYDQSCEQSASLIKGRLGVSVALLFFEFATRVRGGQDLPYLVADQRVQALFAGADDLRRKFHQFVDLVSESDEFLETLIRESRTKGASRTQSGSISPDAPLVAQEGARSGDRPSAEILPLAADPAPSRDQERNEARRLSKALQARMRKIATEELKKMDESRFRSLKRTYLESLDEAGRRVMLDVQKRMQARLFDDHLRQHLIRFMVENPGSWTAPASKSRPRGGAH